MQDKTMSALPVLMGAILATALVSPLAGQGMSDPDRSFVVGTHLGLGYVVNAPDQLAGFTAFTVGSKWSGWGAFADVKFTVDRPTGEDNFTEERSAEEAEGLGDEAFGDPDEVWTTFNAGLVRALSDEVAVYGGAGLSDQTVYQEYVDEDGERGRNGFYVVEDERVGGSQVNVLGGLYFRFSRVITFQFGGETAPTGFTAGVSLMVPLGG